MKINILTNLMMRYGIELGMTQREQVLCWHLLDYDHDGKDFSWPGEETIGKRMGIETRKGVSEIVRSLEAKNILIVKRDRGRRNEYHFTRLRELILPYLEREIQGEKSDKNAEGMDRESINQMVNSEQESIHIDVHTQKESMYQMVNGGHECINEMVYTSLPTSNEKVYTLAQDLRKYAPNGGVFNVHYTPKGVPNSFSLSSNNILVKERDALQLDLEKISISWWDKKAIPLWIKNVTPRMQLKAKQHPGGLCGDQAHAFLVRIMDTNWVNLGEEEFTKRFENFTLSNNSYYLSRCYSLLLFCQDFQILMQPNHERKKNGTNRNGNGKFIHGKIIRHDASDKNGSAGNQMPISDLRDTLPY